MIVVAIRISIARNETEQTTEQNKQTNKQTNNDKKRKKRGDHGRENSKGVRRRMELEAVEVGRWSWKK
jgi:hypothetical protein